MFNVLDDVTSEVCSDFLWVVSHALKRYPSARGTEGIGLLNMEDYI